MTRFKLVLGTILLLLTVLIILQNSAPVETKFLFFSLVLPQALLLLLTILIGFALGVRFCSAAGITGPRVADAPIEMVKSSGAARRSGPAAFWAPLQSSPQRR